MTKKNEKKGAFNPSFNPNLNSNVNFLTRKKTIMDIEIFTVDQLMKILSVSEPTLLGLVRRGEIPYFRLGKKAIRFERKAIEKWLSDLQKNAGVA
jgi:excisionase family DNA binding protein